MQTIAFVRTRLAAELIFKNTPRPAAAASRRGWPSRCRPTAAATCPRSGARSSGGWRAARSWASRARTRSNWASTSAAWTPASWSATPAPSPASGSRPGAPGAGREESLVFLVGAELAHRPVPDGALRLPLRAEPRAGRGRPGQPAHRHRPPQVRGARAAARATTRRTLFGAYAERDAGAARGGRAASSTSRAAGTGRSTEYPAAQVNLRNICRAGLHHPGRQPRASRVIGTMDEVSALSQLHDHAVYLHGAETYFVEQAGPRAEDRVRRASATWTTTRSRSRPRRSGSTRRRRSASWRGCDARASAT